MLYLRRAANWMVSRTERTPSKASLCSTYEARALMSAAGSPFTVTCQNASVPLFPCRINEKTYVSCRSRRPFRYDIQYGGLSRAGRPHD